MRAPRAASASERVKGEFAFDPAIHAWYGERVDLAVAPQLDTWRRTGDMPSGTDAANALDQALATLRRLPAGLPEGARSKGRVSVGRPATPWDER